MTDEMRRQLIGSLTELKLHILDHIHWIETSTDPEKKWLVWAKVRLQDCDDSLKALTS